MKSENKSGGLLIPQHNELSLFLIGVSILSLLVIDSEFRGELLNLKAADAIFWPIPICLLFFGQGIIFTFIHIIVEGPKGTYEKFCMFCFAVCANLTAGIAACVHAFQTDGFGLLIIFPIWNLISGALLMGMVVLTLASGSDVQSMEEAIDDEDATRPQVAIGLLVVVLTIGVCHFVCELYWAMTFSMCVAYTSNIDRLIRGLAHKSGQTS